MWTTSFRPGSGQSFTTEWLYTHDRADHITVDVSISGPDLFGYVLLCAVYSAVHTQGQAVPCVVDILNHPVKITCAVPDNVQDRAKHLAFESLDVIYFESTGCEK